VTMFIGRTRASRGRDLAGGFREALTTGRRERGRACGHAPLALRNIQFVRLREHREGDMHGRAVASNFG
jgi:hypothetical protein